MNWTNEGGESRKNVVLLALLLITTQFDVYSVSILYFRYGVSATGFITDHIVEHMLEMNTNLLVCVLISFSKSICSFCKIMATIQVVYKRKGLVSLLYLDE